MRRCLRAFSCLSVAILGVPAADAAAQSADDQIALAVLPLPEPDRATATVMDYQSGKLVTLKKGTGAFICLADEPGNARFHVACYHKSLEPYMARGRALSAQGMDGQASIQQRWEEIDAGTLEMPRHPAAMYQLVGGSAPSAPYSTEGLRRLTVIYTAYATAEDVGLPTRPADGLPWLMFPGKPTAHVMISN